VPTPRRSSVFEFCRTTERVTMSKQRFRQRLNIKRRRQTSPPLRLEAMESRLLLAQIFVNSTGDSSSPPDGTITLREAILIADGTFPISTLGPGSRALIFGGHASPAPDSIEFNISAGGTIQTISPTSPLPAITEPTTIDGFLESGSAENPISNVNIDTQALT